MPSLFPLVTDKSLSDVDFLTEDIKNIISKLGSNKAHGDDMVNIRMLKLCHKSFCKPLNIIFKFCLTQGIFGLEWKKANVVTIHRKRTSDVLKITNRSLFCQSVAKYLNVLFTARCSHIS